MIPTQGRTWRGTIAETLLGLAEPQTLRLLCVGLAASLFLVALGLAGASFFAATAIRLSGSSGGIILTALSVFASVQSFALTGLPFVPLPAEAMGVALLERRLATNASGELDPHPSFPQFAREVVRVIAAVQLWSLPASIGLSLTVLGASRLAGATSHTALGLLTLVSVARIPAIIAGGGLLLAVLWLMVFFIFFPILWVSLVVSRLVSGDLLGFISVPRVWQCLICMQGRYTKYVADNGARYVMTAAALLVATAIVGVMGVLSSVLVLGLWVGLSTAGSLAYYDYVGLWFGNDLSRIIASRAEPNAFQRRRGRELLAAASVLVGFTILMVVAALSATFRWFQEWSGILHQVIDGLMHVVRGVAKGSF